MAWYVQPNSPVGTVFTTQVIQSAEGAYPITAVKDLPIVTAGLANEVDEVKK